MTTPEEKPAAIQSHGLSKRFKTIKALDEVSLQVPEGSVFGFLGPNGSGKSTFIRIITGLIKADAGHFEIFGKHSRIGPSVRTGIGALVDRADFYVNLSAFHNMELLGRLTNHHQTDRIHDLLDLMGLYDRRNDKVKTFSQGMKQRLGIAQALLSDPNLLILDEPTTGLDPIGMVDVRDFIRKIASERNVTVFLSSHMLHEVEEICSHFALIFNGKLTIEGPIEKIYQASEEITLELETDDPEGSVNALESSRLVSEVRMLPNVIKFRIKHRAIPELVQYLTQEQIRIFSLSQRNRLEEFFISNTQGDRTR